jgi:hypothetical protein
MAADVLLCVTSKLCLHSNLRTGRQLALQPSQSVAFFQQHVKGERKTALYLLAGCAEVLVVRTQQMTFHTLSLLLKAQCECESCKWITASQKPIVITIFFHNMILRRLKKKKGYEKRSSDSC